ncbi:hypothetical protein [Streptodolium elevatio]|uniref:Uncharacterized protein n=1 Tax=Streptodolium elevatio TaxID=3157996 RepID=A0ABV3D9I3_9ACTN
MGAKTGGAVLDRIVYRWQERDLLGARGLGPVATSLAPDRLPGWARELQAYVGMKVDVETGPYTSVCWARTTAGPALVHREFALHGHEAIPGNVAHVVVDPGRVLGPHVVLALGVFDWAAGGPPLDDMPQGYHLEGIASEGLVALAHERAAGLRAAARGRRDALERVAETLFARPRAALSLLQRDAGPDPAPLLWGVFDLVSHLVRGSWSFSTYESSDDASRPRFVVVPDWPGADFPGRLRLDVTAPPGTGLYAEAARRLVECYAERPWEQTRALLRQLRPVAELEPEPKAIAILDAIDTLFPSRVSLVKARGPARPAVEARQAAPPRGWDTIARAAGPGAEAASAAAVFGHGLADYLGVPAELDVTGTYPGEYLPEGPHSGRHARPNTDVDAASGMPPQRSHDSWSGGRGGGPRARSARAGDVDDPYADVPVAADPGPLEEDLPEVPGVPDVPEVPVAARPAQHAAPPAPSAAARPERTPVLPPHIERPSGPAPTQPETRYLPVALPVPERPERPEQPRGPGRPVGGPGAGRVAAYPPGPPPGVAPGSAPPEATPPGPPLGSAAAAARAAAALSAVPAGPTAAPAPPVVAPAPPSERTARGWDLAGWAEDGVAEWALQPLLDASRWLDGGGATGDREFRELVGRAGLVPVAVGLERADEALLPALVERLAELVVPSPRLPSAREQAALERVLAGLDGPMRALDRCGVPRHQIASIIGQFAAYVLDGCQTDSTADNLAVVVRNLDTVPGTYRPYQQELIGAAVAHGLGARFFEEIGRLWAASRSLLPDPADPLEG